MDRTSLKRNNNEIRYGFGFSTEAYLRKHDNAAADPDIQVFDNEDDEEPEQPKYFCALCKSKLTYMKHTNTIWKCDNCQEIYDTSLQDRPVTNNREFKIRPHHSISRYPKMDDMDIPYMKGIKLDEGEDQDIELVRSSEDQRIKHYRIRDNCTREEAYSKARDL